MRALIEGREEDELFRRTEDGVGGDDRGGRGARVNKAKPLIPDLHTAMMEVFAVKTGCTIDEVPKRMNEMIKNAIGYPCAEVIDGGQYT